MNRPEIVARMVGTERQPVVAIDHFHPAPETLRDHAAGTGFQPAERHYPGLRAALPASYFDAVRAPLLHVLREVFGYPGGVELLDASFSIVTTKPADLSVAQRLPHVDATDPRRIALVHFLQPGGGDGTAFFRHRATGYETISAARAPAYRRTVEHETAASPPPAAYIADDNGAFERLASIDGAYNRAILYRSCLLHSGAISPAATLSADPARGRLTVTAFFAPA